MKKSVISVKKNQCILLTSLFLTERQQVSVRCLWKGAVLFSAAFKKFSSIFICADGKPNRGLLDTLLHLRGGGRGGSLSLLHSQEDEHSRGFLEKVLHRLVSEPTQLGLNLSELESQPLDNNVTVGCRTATPLTPEIKNISNICIQMPTPVFSSTWELLTMGLRLENRR